MNTLSLWAIYHPQLKFLNDVNRTETLEWSTEFDLDVVMTWTDSDRATEFLKLFGLKMIAGQEETQVIELKFQCINLPPTTEPKLTREEIISRSKL